MKLRALALLLALANVGFFAWSQGWLDAFGARGAADREPDRIARQFQPQLLRVLPGAAGAAAMAGSPAAAATCLEAGPFAAEEADAALAQWRARGVSTARIAAAAAAASATTAANGAMLRIDNADAALEARLAAIGTADAPLGRPFARCAK